MFATKETSRRFSTFTPGQRQRTQSGFGQSKSAEPSSDSTHFRQRYLGNSHLQPDLPGSARQKECDASFGCVCPGCKHRRRPAERVQTKPMLGPTDDIYERGADRSAQQVVRMPDPSTQSERNPFTSGLDIKPIANGNCSGVNSGQDIELSQAGGRPLSASTRRFMEPRFGADFGQVRLHEDQHAHQTASQIQARAFTYGNHIWLGKGEGEQKRNLMAHELTHVVQQGFAQVPIQQAPPSESNTLSDQNLGQAAIGGETVTSSISMQSSRIQRNGTCEVDNCPADHGTSVPADLQRAIGYVNDALTAIDRSPLAQDTVAALDWFFRDHSTATIETIRNRLTCILWALNDTRDNNRYACDPEDSAIAYVRVGSPPICGHLLRVVCLTDIYFRRSDRVRAETMIHECGHREGLSVGTDDDIYEHTARFMHISTEQALANADSYALFAGSIAGGIPLAFLLSFRTGAEVALPAEGGPTWSARLDLDTEFQHPVLSIFNPILGMHMSVIGAPEPRGGSGRTTPNPTLLVSLVSGVRIGQPRAGAGGAGYVSIFGGPALDVVRGRIAAGAEAGISLGYRWRFLDVSLGARYLYAPTRPEGSEHMIQVGGTIGFTPQILSP